MTVRRRSSVATTLIDNRHWSELSLCSPVTLPFLRWPGGKRWLPVQLVDLLRGIRFGRYFEPFLGGGAVYFALRPANSTLSDLNEDLINTYRQVRRCPFVLESALRALPVNARTYGSIRASCPRSAFDRATRFLYLNRTAFAGMYRTNKSGMFNVPFGEPGRTLDVLWRGARLSRAARALKGTELMACDFEEIVNRAGQGDLVYCDPIYSVVHNDNGFVRYNETVFSWRDQERLCCAAPWARRRGATGLVSNANHTSV